MTDDRRSLLRRVPIFAELSETELGEIHTTTKTLRPGEILFRRGDAASSAYVVAGGRLRVTGDRELVFQIMGPGSVLGELSLFDRRGRTHEARSRRSATVTAIGAVRLLGIDRADFLAAVRRHPTIALKLLAELGGRVRELNAALEDSLFLGLPERLARKLLSLARSFGRPVAGGGLRIELVLAQKQLGQMIGFSRESVNKLMRAWSRAGLVSMARGVITVRDPAALDAIARLPSD